MKPEALILTSDLELSESVRAAVERFGIATGVGLDATDTRRELEKNKFDLIVVDCSDLEQGCAALREMRLNRTHRSAVSIAIIGNPENRKHVSEAGADFVISHTNYQVEIAATLRSAYGLILRERGRYSRFPLVAEVNVRCGALVADGWILNVSQGGLCIRGIDQLLHGAVQLLFALEDGGARIEVAGTKVWQRGDMAGIQFSSMSKSSRAVLEEWLARQFEIQTMVRPPSLSRASIPLIDAAPHEQHRTALVPNTGEIHPIVTAIIRGGPVRAKCSLCHTEIKFGNSIGDSLEQERKLREAFSLHLQDRHKAELRNEAKTASEP